MKMVMEKSWNIKNWPKVMEFVFISYGILPILLPNCTRKFSNELESLHFSARRHKCKIRKTAGHGKIEKWSWKYILSSLWEP